jgi:hypothetical protein
MKTVIIILISSILFLSCDNILPLPSKSGKNIFGCKIEGKVIKPTSRSLFSEPLSARMSNTFFSVSASDYNDNFDVNIIVTNVSKKGEYILDGKLGSAFVYTRDSPATAYGTTLRYKGKVCVTKFDTVKKIVAGTFIFEAVNRKDSTDIIKVTKGRFDLKID